MVLKVTKFNLTIFIYAAVTRGKQAVRTPQGRCQPPPLPITTTTHSSAPRMIRERSWRSTGTASMEVLASDGRLGVLPEPTDYVGEEGKIDR